MRKAAAAALPPGAAGPYLFVAPVVFFDNLINAAQRRGFCLAVAVDFGQLLFAISVALPKCLPLPFRYRLTS